MIKVEHVSKNFGQLHALNDVSLEVNKGEIVSLIGPSGSGKSTLLRSIHGLEQVDSGKIYMNGELMDPSDKEKYREQRNHMGFVFQHFNLFPNMTVLENLNLAQIQVLNKSKEEATQVSSAYLEKVGLYDKKDAYPNNLSGGQKQRVAIARALASQPKVLLCDESTSALDPQTTQSILQLIKKINRELKLTVVMITHEMAVVKEVCDRVAVMENGMVVEQGNIVDVFTDPQQPVTRAFINTTNNLGKIDEFLVQNHPLVALEENQQLVKLQYQSKNTSQALISQLSREYNVDCSIIFGNVEVIQQTPIGTLITIFTGEYQDIKKALQVCREHGVHVEVMKK